MRLAMGISFLGLLLAACGAAPIQQGAPRAAEVLEAAEAKELPGEFERRRSELEALVARSEYALARDGYQELRTVSSSPEQIRWCDFRIADCGWRALASSQQPDTSALEAARQGLVVLVRDVKLEAEQDEVWAQIHESLGDWCWTRRDMHDWGQAWPHYESALSHWARSRNIESARRRYLDIVFRAATPNGLNEWVRGFWIGLPEHVVQAAVRIAVTPEDRARAHLLRAATLQGRGHDVAGATQVIAEFESALALGREQPWYDDALFALAQWLESRGRARRDAQGNWGVAPDFVKARELYLRLAKEFPSGRARWRDEAVQAAGRIAQAELSLHVERHFLPGSIAAFALNWRNVSEVEFALYQLDPAAGIEDWDDAEWFRGLDPRQLERVKNWTMATGDEGLHQPGAHTVRVDGELAPGAYLLTAKGNGAMTAREVLLVSDASLLVTLVDRRAAAWFVDVRTGAPIADARVEFWQRMHVDGRWRLERISAVTRADGLAEIELALSPTHSRDVLAIAHSGSRVAWTRVQHWNSQSDAERWRVQVLTDRPTYRPEDTVGFKIVARRRAGERYVTPSGEKLRYVVRDAQGAQRKEAVVTLNEFGSASGELPLDASMPLGEFHIELQEAESAAWIAGAEFFQLEEYKLPEFEVSVTPTAAESGARVRTGDRVQAKVRARLYSGGPVPGAKVNLVVRQSPFTVERKQEREFPWLHVDSSSRGWRWGRNEMVVLEQTLVTDDQGEALVTFDTPYDANSDLEYTLEARVTDASRREVVGVGRVRVGRQSHYVFARALHQLHRVGEPVEIEFESVDAEGEAAPVAGVVLVKRLRWYRTWFDPAGRAVSNAEYELARAEPGFDATRWREERSGYEREHVSRHDLQLDAAGRAKFEFRAARHGCYEIEWTSLDVDGGPIRAVASVFVADESSTDLAWRRGGLEVVLDRDTLREGEDALLLVTSASGVRHVLLTVESDVLHSSQVLELTGEAKLVRVPLDERHVPNVFIRVQGVVDATLHADVEELIVPPRRQFLALEVVPSAPDSLPGAKLAWRVTTLDHAGEPTRAEVALAVFDESVAAIAGDRNQDPRPFFYGEKRDQEATVAATLMDRRYGNLVERDGELRELETALKESEDDGRLALGRSASPLAGARGAPSSPGSLRHDAKSAAMSEEGGASRDSAGGALVVRSDFRATAFWKADLVTGVDGVATVEVTMPQSLTRWRASAHAITTRTEVGFGQARATTSLPLAVRLQAPRFFVAGDVATISALVDNNTDLEREVEVGLERDGLAFAHADGPKARPRIPAHGQARVEWKVAFERFGSVKFRVWARAGEHSDAMERSYPVIEHGLEQLITRNGKLSAERGVVTFDLPGPRRAGSSSLEIALNPNLAITLLDALPYLIDYPYGCVEQTMSRFLPAVIVARTLRELGLEPEAAFGRVFGGVEGEFAAKTHPKGAKSLELLAEVSQAGLARLYEFQHSNGAWGWWKEGGDDRFMSAYVLWGLCLAREAGVDVRWDAAQRCASWLDTQLIECEERPDDAAWLLHALGAFAALEKRATTDSERAALARLWTQRDSLNGYTRSLAALASHGFASSDFAQTARAKEWVRQLVNGVQVDRTPDTSLVMRGGGSTSGYVLPTAHWGVSGASWRWSEGAVEATSSALRALLAIEPEHELVEPAVNWLVRNRRGAQWASTRDSALAVLALASHLRRTGVAAEDCEYAVRVNGAVVAVPSLDGVGALAAPTRVSVPAELLRDGRNEVELVRVRGAGPVYFALEARCFSLEEPIRAAGSELFVRREYYALLPRETLLSGVQYERVPLAQAGVLSSGTRVEVVVTLETKNDLEYVLLEDNKPAGLEAVDTVSGDLWASRLRADAVEARLSGAPRTAAERFTGAREWTHRELRDRKVALFLGRVPQGVWELSYVLRAETPGQFHALPLVGQAMYVPEIRANDAECGVAIE